MKSFGYSNDGKNVFHHESRGGYHVSCDANGRDANVTVVANVTSVDKIIFVI